MLDLTDLITPRTMFYWDTVRVGKKLIIAVLCLPLFVIGFLVRAFFD